MPDINWLDIALTFIIVSFGALCIAGATVLLRASFIARRVVVSIRQQQEEQEKCGYCLQRLRGYARLADGTRVCHSDDRSCYNAATYGMLGLSPRARAAKRDADIRAAAKQEGQ